MMILLITKHLKSYLKGFIKKITKEEAKRKQYEFNAIIGVLEDYTPRNNKYIERENKLLNNVKWFHKGREEIIEEFKNGIFPFNYDEASEKQMRFDKWKWLHWLQIT